MQTPFSVSAFPQPCHLMLSWDAAEKESQSPHRLLLTQTYLGSGFLHSNLLVSDAISPRSTEPSRVSALRVCSSQPLLCKQLPQSGSSLIQVSPGWLSLRLPHGYSQMVAGPGVIAKASFLLASGLRGLKQLGLWAAGTPMVFLSLCGPASVVAYGS